MKLSASISGRIGVLDAVDEGQVATPRDKAWSHLYLVELVVRDAPDRSEDLQSLAAFKARLRVSMKTNQSPAPRRLSPEPLPCPAWVNPPSTPTRT